MKFTSTLVVLAALAIAVSAMHQPTGIVPGRYIAVFKDGFTAAQRAQVLGKWSSAVSIKPSDHFDFSGFAGFSFGANNAAVAAELAAHPMIKYVEPDQYVSVDAKADNDDPLCRTQRDATWGINRVAERKLKLDGDYKYEHLGSAVDAYIIDTGILLTHKEFAKEDGSSRAVWGTNTAGDNKDTDCNGHGTHVAGTVGGNTYGIAKNVNLIAVKVLNCMGSGTNAGVIGGMNWVATQREQRKRPSVANMSLGGGFSQAINDAATAMNKAGVVLCVSAGNDNNDACRKSPASAPDAISTGATAVIDDSSAGGKNDSRSTFSNYGTCVTIFAPGTKITSAWIGSDTATSTISGTSMATPHVTGVSALYLVAHPSSTPDDVKAGLTSTSTPDLISMNCLNEVCKKSPNKLLFSSC